MLWKDGANKDTLELATMHYLAIQGCLTSSLSKRKQLTGAPCVVACLMTSSEELLRSTALCGWFATHSNGHHGI